MLSSVKNKAVGEASLTTVSTGRGGSSVFKPKHCYVCRTKVVCRLWQGSPARLLMELATREPHKLPDHDRLNKLAQSALQRVTVCQRHLAFLDGVAVAIDASSPTAARRQRRSSVVQEARATTAQAEAAKKERALLLKAQRELESEANKLDSLYESVLKRRDDLHQAIARARATFGDSIGSFTAPDTIGKQVWVLPLAPEVVANNDMLSYYYFFRSLSALESFVASCKVNLGRMQLDPRTAVYLTLVRLRRGMPLKELAYLFSISPNKVSRAIDKALPQMAGAVRPSLCAREDLQRYVPAGHRALLPSAVLVVDGTYIYTPAPAAGAYQRLSFVSHKKRHAQKVLVLTYPNGRIAMISKPCGNASDETMLLELLEEDRELRSFLREGDQLVGDRGFQDTAV
eukprot:TRINITY_DN8804_c0_g1_i1.p1 TRINITY_DN8804_c0_g1~~TRINITY_DN8804_c0_g1_i1.p1  ORF type:complete len:401 (+),score=22.83 TRINITY_DN8804_c0_g1_i1:289-1491(+)